jgi:hypothetical protein
MLLSRVVGLLQLSYLLTCGMYVQVSVVLQGFRKCPTKVSIHCQTINDQNNLNTATFISPTKVLIQCKTIYDQNNQNIVTFIRLFI